jgi:hypothetical protein
MAASFATSFFSSGDDDDDDDESDNALNAFTFSLLGQLKESLVTYDNSMKGFLDTKTSAVRAALTSQYLYDQ